MSTINPRFTVSVTEEMLKEIDDFRFENRYSTRNQAVNELLRVGLEGIKKKISEKTKKKGSTLPNSTSNIR